MNEKETEYVKRCWDIEETSDRKKKTRTLQQPEGNLTGNGTKKVVMGETGKIMHVKSGKCLKELKKKKNK